MKIHTTQNLNSLVQNNQLTTNNVSSKDFRLKNYSEQMLMPKLSAESADVYSSSISFRGLFGKKKSILKDAKKIISMRKKKVGDIKQDPQPEKKKGDKFLTGSLFDKMLKLSNFGPITQAVLAALVCTILRPATIMVMPDKNGKANNKYAAAHSISSGIAGFVLTTPLTYPFKQGGKYAQSNLIKNMKPEVLKRLFPQIDIKSITDATGKRLDMKLWKDIEGNRFSDNNKLVDMLPKFRHLADVSEYTFDKILGIKDVDWAAYKGKSFNDVVLKDGRKLYDVINPNRLGIVVKEEGFGKAQFLLRDLNYEYLQKLVKDADGNWNKLDVDSVYADAEHKIVKDFREWKDIKGNPWKLDLNEVRVSSEFETADYRPRRTGEKRFDKKDKEYKFYSFQDNEKDGRLGTKITEEMVDADLANEGQMKLIEWLPDLAFRIPIAATTIAMIPYVLKKVFNLEKHKKAEPEANTIKNTSPEPAKQEVVKPAAATVQPTFKGKAKEPSKFVKWLGETFGAWVIKNPTIHKYSGKLSLLQGKLTAHMSTVGSLITSSVYVQQTLSKKDLDSDKRTTLAINQILCFIVPTILAYTADAKLDKFVKNNEYRYTGLNKQKRFLAEAKGKPYTEEQLKVLSDKTKGIRVLASLLIFTTIYRYVSPVLITPIANKIGDWYNEKHAAKKLQKAKEVAMNSDAEKAKEISINSTNENTQAKQVA